jgi:hypothetical protein
VWGPMSSSNRLISLQCFIVVCTKLLPFCDCFSTLEISDFLENLIEATFRNWQEQLALQHF